MKRRMIFGLLLTCFFSLYFCAQATAAPPYPTKGIDLICATPPGGATDITARLLAQYLSKILGVQLSVINKAGAGGVTGTLYALEARPDGYTMFVENHGCSSGLAAFKGGKLPFDWRKRTWIARMTKDPIIYSVRMDAPWKTLKEVAEFVNKNPQTLRVGVAGVGAMGTAALTQFFKSNSIPYSRVVLVYFQGGSAVLAALAGGHIDFAAQSAAGSWGLIEGKKIRPVATISDKRLPLPEEVPTVAEAGYPMLDVIGWHGISGPPGLPEYVVDTWVEALEKAAKDPEFQKKAKMLKKEMAYLGPKELEEYVEWEYKKYLELAKHLERTK